MNPYRPQDFEARWQAFWEAEGLHRARGPGEPGFEARQPKFYVLDMFPYPSGSGLHVGHALGYVGTDVVARKKRMQGFNVLHPMGWDAFGLPAEQYAIQTGKHPRATTDENTANFRKQLKKIGLSYDWSREIDTSQVAYYRWTQWLFNRLYERGLAYRAEVPVWWCEELKTVLANEEVINGRSERGNFPCVRRPLKQWMLKITAYAERLLADLEGLDWPESIKIQQREWIGRSEGAEVRFAAEGSKESIAVFTTRPDTLWGATFLVLSPEHTLAKKLTAAPQRAAVEAYVAAAASKSELDRTDGSKQKTGVFSGAYATNPVFEKGDPRGRVPIWVADYVLAQYGTGAIMSVPGHDERDFEFARAFGLEIREVVRPPQGEKGLADGVCFSGDGTAVHSGPIDGLATPEAKKRANAWLEERGLGQARVTYKLRDWLFSRQRYWGEPFPLLHLEDGSVVPVPDEFLPVELPLMDDFKPASDGSAPLARAKDWVATIDPRTRKPARRDTDTMPGWAGSCWYWLRFMDPHNGRAAFSKEAEHYWGPVDLYVGGAAHAVMHLLYARFWHKVFFDAGLVHTKEPFQELYNQGMLTAFAYEDAGGRLVASEAAAQGGWRAAEADRHQDGEVAEERRQPRRRDRRAGLRHVPPLRAVHGTARRVEALEPARHPGLPALLRAHLAPVRGSRGRRAGAPELRRRRRGEAARGRHARRRARAGAHAGEGGGVVPPPELQHGDRGADDVPERGAADPGRADALAGPALPRLPCALRAAHRGRTLAQAGRARERDARDLAAGRGEVPRDRHARDPRAGARQAARKDHAAEGGDEGRDRGGGTRGRGRASGRQGRRQGGLRRGTAAQLRREVSSLRALHRRRGRLRSIL